MTQLDSLTRTVNNLVVDNTENFNKLVDLDVVTSYMLVVFLGFLLTVVLGLVLYVVYRFVSDKVYDFRRTRMKNMSEKRFNDLVKNTSFTDWLFEKNSRRKYEILTEVSKYVDEKYVKGVTEFVWDYYKTK